jgi:hypothetical protein
MMRPVRCQIVRALCSVLLASGLLGCEEAGLPIEHIAHPLTAICTVEVVKNGSSLGVKDVEKDYLPNVVNCESGDLATEALKTQAVLSRTYVYYKLASGGTAITSGTDVQVYDCPPPGRKGLLAQKHYDAVNATAGQILLYTGKPIWPCFNAGKNPTNPPCAPSGGADYCCTNNIGKSGNAITQSPCGFVDPTNWKNRGCICQWGSDCYAKQGKSYVEILKAGFGDDIQLDTVSGSCIHPVEAGAPNGDGSSPVKADLRARSDRDAVVPPSTDRSAPVVPEAGDGRTSIGGGCSCTIPSLPESVDVLPPVLLLGALLLLGRRRAR